MAAAEDRGVAGSRARVLPGTIAPLTLPLTLAPGRARTAALTVAALVGFAANSLLCRAALAQPAIDPVSFTALRLVAGALVLLLVVRARGRGGAVAAGRGIAAAALLVYALAFSLAYVALSASAGALLLFGAVQVTMVGHGLWCGERPGPREGLGLLLAGGGLIGLVAPGVTAPPVAGAALMATAGVAWGVYSLLGRGVAQPLRATADNFARTLPWIAVAAALSAVVGGLQVSMTGALLAVASGALASGVGYALWYAALRGHSATSAAIVQLAVPVLASAGGVALLGEALTLRLLLAAIAILSGIALAVLGRR